LAIPRAAVAASVALLAPVRFLVAASVALLASVGLAVAASALLASVAPSAIPAAVLLLAPAAVPRLAPLVVLAPVPLAPEPFLASVRLALVGLASTTPFADLAVRPLAPPRRLALAVSVSRRAVHVALLA